MSKQIVAKQHFVPRFYLKRFADPQGRLAVLNVKEKRLGPKRPYQGLCWGKFFYAATTGAPDDASQEIERWLEAIESYVASRLPGIIDRILGLERIEDDDKYTLAVLMSMLWIRGPRMRQQINRMTEDLFKQIQSRTVEWQIEQYLRETGENWTAEQKRAVVAMVKEGKYDLELSNALHLRFMVESLGLGREGFANLFFGKRWVVYLARGRARFVTSDSPLVEWSPPLRGIYGRTFLEREHFLALTPEIFIEVLHPGGGKGVKRKTLFCDHDDLVKMYNCVLADHCVEHAYSGDRDVLADLLSGATSPGAAERLYFERFVRPWREYRQSLRPPIASSSGM